MLNFKDWLKSSESEPATPQTEIPTGTKAWWRYGYYCGPGPRLRQQTCDRLAAGQPLPEPMNAVDAACQQHDIEYCRCGVGWSAGILGGLKTNTCSLQSDDKLVARLNALKDLPLKQKIAANTIKKYFDLHMRTKGHQRADSKRIG